MCNLFFLILFLETKKIFLNAGQVFDEDWIASEKKLGTEEILSRAADFDTFVFFDRRIEIESYIPLVNTRTAPFFYVAMVSPRKEAIQKRRAF